MEITAKMVQELRERSGAPLMDCKKALSASAGDMEAAIDFLRKSGQKTADKKSGRAMGAGRVAARIDSSGQAGAIVALCCETDFVARTEDFTRLLGQVVELGARERLDSPEALLAQRLPGADASVAEAIKQLVGKIGENMTVGSVASFQNPAGRVGAYVHFNNTIGALVSVSSNAPAAGVDEFIKRVGMQITALRPTALSRQDIPAEMVEREQTVLRESDDLKDKPADRIEKILQGRMEKFFAERALLEQEWVHDTSGKKLSVQQALAQELGPQARIEAFKLVAIGA